MPIATITAVSTNSSFDSVDFEKKRDQRHPVANLRMVIILSQAFLEEREKHCATFQGSWHARSDMKKIEIRRSDNLYKFTVIVDPTVIWHSF